MGKKPESSKQIDRLQTQSRARASEIISDDARFKRFPDSPLATIDPRFSQTSAFLGGAPSPYAQSLAPQRLAGMTYGNLPGTTTAFYPQANVAPPVATTPPASGGVGSGASQPGSSFDSLPEDSQSIIASIRQDLDLPTFGSYEDLVPKPIPKKAAGNIGRQTRIKRENKAALDRWNKGKAEFEARLKGDSEPDSAPEPERAPDSEIPFSPTFGDDLMLAAQGGIASLPVEMSGGGMPGGMELYGGAPEPTGMQKFGTMMTGLSGKLKDFSSELAGGSSSQGDADLENMSKEQLIALIMQSRGGMRSNPSAGRDPSASSSSGPDIGQIAQLASMVGGMQSGGLAALAQGGDVDFPRMNGPIDGPGTETSDDIPAMLSDGEFVVNAKAVRGVGRMNGAGKSKEEQRREGARMMYALQKAGEQAMRKA